MKEAVLYDELTDDQAPQCNPSVMSTMHDDKLIPTSTHISLSDTTQPSHSQSHHQATESTSSYDGIHLAEHSVPSDTSMLPSTPIEPVSLNSDTGACSPHLSSPTLSSGSDVIAVQEITCSLDGRTSDDSIVPQEVYPAARPAPGETDPSVSSVFPSPSVPKSQYDSINKDSPPSSITTEEPSTKAVAPLPNSTKNCVVKRPRTSTPSRPLKQGTITAAFEVLKRKLSADKEADTTRDNVKVPRNADSDR